MNDHVERSIWLITSELASLETLLKEESLSTREEMVDIKWHLATLKTQLSKLERALLKEEQHVEE